MISNEQQKDILDQIKAATMGLPKDERDSRRQVLLVGAIIALGGECPPAWRSLTLVGRTQRLFRR